MHPLAGGCEYPVDLSAGFRLGCSRYGMKIFIDGKYFDEGNAKISVFDHGLLYGDGIFEGIRAYHGRVFKLKEHIDRLFCSAKSILLNMPLLRAEIVKAILETCRRNKLRDGYIR